MRTGFQGTFVISWSQTEIDGLDAAPLGALAVGSAWSWRGDTIRVDGPNGVLRLDRAEGEAELRRRAAYKLRRLLGAARPDREGADYGTDYGAGAAAIDAPLSECSFVVTDGAQSYTVTVIGAGPGLPPLLMFLDSLPPRGTDLWVVRHDLGQLTQARPEPDPGGVICFTPGTQIATPQGPRPVETLREGDRIATRDSGPQQVQWIGSRRITGARMHVMPHLRPVRLRSGALGIERPDQELLVSPQHRMLLHRPAARALFNTDQVLVAARDLVNGSSVIVDHAVREVTYIHLLLPSHQIVLANGVETESFHPANADLGTLAAGDRQRLLAQRPELDVDPHLYGAFARRSLSRSEAAILLHEAA